MNSRQKGLVGVREVKKILEAGGSRVTNPGYRPLFIKGRMAAVHCDFFGIFDLISLDNEGVLHGHQVTVCPEQKNRKIKLLQDARVSGKVWVKYPRKKKGSLEPGGWRAWYVDPSDALEVEPR